MDELARQLKQDAGNIDVVVSPELDQRIRASLESFAPETGPRRRKERARPAGFWWASSLTGIAAAAAVIVIVNTQQVNTQQEESAAASTPAGISAAVPSIDWKTESATLTGQLEQELDALQSDIKKAEEKVKQEIGL